MSKVDCPKEDMRRTECRMCEFLCLRAANKDVGRYKELKKVQTELCDRLNKG